MLTLHIQLISRPEMTMKEVKTLISWYFPGIDADAFTLKADTESGIVSLTLHQDALTDEQHDWLHMTPFAARYIDSFRVEVVKEQERDGIRIPPGHSVSSGLDSRVSKG